MEAKLFADLTKILGATDAGSSLSKVVLKHATKPQTKKLAKDFEELYSTSKAGKVSVRRKPTASVEAVAVQDGDLVSKKIGVKLGGYGHEAGAQQAAQEFLHPNVFQYQSALFPDPRTHRVTVLMAEAKAINLGAQSNPLYPWGVKLQLEVTGAKVKVDSWIQQFTNQIRVHSTKS